jgi:hypothetical protein
VSSSRRPITWTATPTDAGRVEYDVDKVGTFTLGYCTSTYAGYDDQARLEVGFGRWREDVYVNPGRPRGDGLIRPHPAESREPAIAACAAWQRDPCSGLVTRGFRSVARRRHGGRRRPTRLDSWRFGPRR